MNNLENFSFAHPNAGLLLLGLLPIYFWLLRQETIFTNLLDSTLSPLLKRLRFPQKMPRKNQELQLLMLGILLITIALMRPRWGYEVIDTNYKGVDIVVAVDVSDSMLAEDLNPNRLGVAKRKIKDIIRETPQDRIALVSSAGSAFIESPLTLDKASIEMLTSTLEPDLVPLKGSSLTAVIEATFKAVSRASSLNNSSRGSALILLTDGEFDTDDIEYSEELLKRYHITPYAIIFGTPQGAPIPTSRGFKKDSNGKLVISKANFTEIDTLFRKFGGKAVQSDPGIGDVIEIINKGIDKNLKKEIINYQSTKSWKEYFQAPLIFGILLILYTWRKPLRISVNVILFFLILSKLSIVYADPTSLIENARAEQESGHFKAALEILGQIEQNEDNHSSTLLRGNILYRLADFSSAEKEFAKSASLAKSPIQKAQSLYNRGNALLQSGRPLEAKTDYELALRDRPTDPEITNNLEYVKRLLEDPPSPDEREQEKEEEKEKEQDKENKNQEKENKEKGQNEENKQDASQDNESKSESGDSSDQNQNSKENAKERESPSSSSNDKSPTDESKDSQSEKPDAEKNSGTENTEPKPQENKEGPPENTKPPKNQEKAQEKTTGESKAEDGNSNTSEASNAEKNTAELNDQILSQLNSIEEDTSSRQKYRYQKALKELEASSKTIPRRDW